MLKKLIRFVRSYALRGNNVYCSICSKHFITFLPSGDEMRAHARCPSCYSIDRSRQLWLLLQTMLEQNKNGMSILHIAPEKPLLSLLLNHKDITYHAIDKFEKGYNYSTHVKYGDIIDLQFDDNTFDLFICSHVLEHIIDDNKAIQELFRTLKHGGNGLIIVPYFPELKNTFEDFSVASPEERKLKFGQADHVRKYGSDFTHRLEAVGFNVEINKTHQQFNNETKVRLGLINAEIIFIVRKSIAVK